MQVPTGRIPLISCCQEAASVQARCRFPPAGKILFISNVFLEQTLARELTGPQSQPVNPGFIRIASVDGPNSLKGEFATVSRLASARLRDCDLIVIPWGQEIKKHPLCKNFGLSRSLLGEQKVCLPNTPPLLPDKKFLVRGQSRGISYFNWVKTLLCMGWSLSCPLPVS